ncbi:MAG: paraquat-inducible protein A [Polyangiaceae bacterium]|jgi:paraquat-inducible protein A
MPYAVAIDDLPNWRECRDCGLMQKLPEVPDGEAAICIRCDATLRRASTHGLPFARLNAVAAAFLFPLALALPLGKVHILGRTSVASVFSGAEMMHHYGLLPLAVIVVLTLVVMPAMKLIVELTVLIGLFAVRPPRWLAWLFGWLEHISPWAMVEVFVLGSIVAYSRLSAMAVVNVGLAAFALGGTMVAMLTTDATLDYEAIWQRLEGGAPAEPEAHA